MKLNIIIKSLTAFLAVLLAAVTVSSAVSAGSYNDITDPQVENAVAVLDALGIVKGFQDGGFRPDDMLTRGEFSKLAVYMLGLEDKLTSASQRTLFNDVTSAHWAAPYVNLAYDSGIIKGYGNGSFGPDDSVTYVQALTMMLNMLGYTSADIGEYYPDDYIRFADKLGLTDGVESEADAIVTRGTASLMLVNLLRADTGSGGGFYRTVASGSVSDVIVLDTDSVSDTGKRNCVKVYAGGKTSWYIKGADISDSLVGASGIALINDNGHMIGFLPDGTVYDTVRGVLLANSRRSGSSYIGLPYETVLFDGSTSLSFPRTGSISASLNGALGTMLVDENGYAAAFISDETDVYTVVNNAVLLDDLTVSDEGVDCCASFYIGDKTVYYELAYDCNVDSSDIGFTGTALIDADGMLTDFIVDDSDIYDIVYGILIDTDNYEADFLIDGSCVTLDLDCRIASSAIGTYGKILLNERGSVESFITGTADGEILSDAVVLEVNAVSNDGTWNCAKLYVNGKTVWYEQDSTLPAEIIGRTGTAVLDEDGYLIGFYPTEDEYYRLQYGLFIEYKNQTAKFMLNNTIVDFRTYGSVSFGSAGTYGIMLLDDYGRVTGFIADSDSADKYSLSQSGILLTANTTAADGHTLNVRLYVNGNITTYKTYGMISGSYEGYCGRVILNSDNCAVGFVYEDTNCHSIVVSEVYESTLLSSGGSYNVSKNIPVILNGEVMKWENVWQQILPGMNVVLYFDSVGALDVVVIGQT